MPSINDNQPKLARIYDSVSDTWNPLMGVPSPHSHNLSSGSAVGIADVRITNPQDGDILVYDGTIQKWVNQQP